VDSEHSRLHWFIFFVYLGPVYSLHSGEEAGEGYPLPLTPGHVTAPALCVGVGAQLRVRAVSLRYVRRVVFRTSARTLNITRVLTQAFAILSVHPSVADPDPFG
jgi:hypothetical protein